MSSSQLTNSYFSRWLKPPTRWSYGLNGCIHHHMHPLVVKKPCFCRSAFFGQVFMNSKNWGNNREIRIDFFGPPCNKSKLIYHLGNFPPTSLWETWIHGDSPLLFIYWCLISPSPTKLFWGLPFRKVPTKKWKGHWLRVVWKYGSAECVTFESLISLIYDIPNTFWY
jgi:hypothetical protein